MENVTIRILKSNEILFENIDSLVYFNSYDSKYNIILDNVSDLYDSNIAINIYITYYDGLIRTLSYNLWNLKNWEIINFLLLIILSIKIIK